MIKRLMCYILGHKWVEITKDNFMGILGMEILLRHRYLDPNAKAICSRCGRVR